MNDRPRLVLAGLAGGTGKTILTLGLCRAWVRRGLPVIPFKKGPDYIDATWLGLAAGREASNLDPFLMSPDRLRALFLHRSAPDSLALVEGNRGLFDGKDVAGSCSTSELARQLAAPVALVLDCTKMTRTAAAVVAGCRDFEPGLNLAGVILNRTAGPRHQDVAARSIEHHTGLRVLGAVPKLGYDPIPERHMGLVSDQEHGGRDQALDGLGRMAEEHLDVEALLDLARSAPPLADADQPLWPGEPDGGPRVSIGYVRDAALWFYYRENLEALERAGADLVRLSLLSPEPWPELHGLYLGGGFPETQARALAHNQALRDHVRGLAEAGLPIYAECGGFMFLGQSLSWQGVEYPMAGVFPVRTELRPKPQGLGYVEGVAEADNPYHPKGARLTGHEFHYSEAVPVVRDQAPGTVLCLERGSGMFQGRDGLLRKNTFAAYTHIHALSESAEHWAPNFVAAARRYAGR